jgi:cell division protein FtsL
MTPATARKRSRTHARTMLAPRAPRRISGPVPAPAGAAALPRRGTTGLFERIRALPDHRIVDRLLRSRLWIWALGLALGGIVTMQVSLLKLNSGISRAVETTTTLERQNADLEASIARLSSPDRIERGALQLDMLMPAAGDVGYLTARPQDAERAVRRMEPPSDAAAALLANHGVVPGSLAAPATTTPAPAVTPLPVSTPAASVEQPPATAAQVGG